MKMLGRLECSASLMLLCAVFFLGVAPTARGEVGTIVPQNRSDALATEQATTSQSRRRRRDQTQAPYHDAERERQDCHAAKERAAHPEWWDWRKLSHVQDLHTITGVGAYPLKNWLVRFWGGKRYGGVDAVLKIRGFWAPQRAGLLTSGFNHRTTTRGAVEDWHPLISKFKCEYWDRDEGEPGFRGITSMRWAMDTNGSSWSFGSADRLLNEVVAHHVDKILGLRTVPPGRLVAMTTSTWARWFGEFVCAQRFELLDFLSSTVDTKSDDANGDNPMVVMGWLTNVVAPLVHNPRILAELGCGAVEPNVTRLARDTSPQFFNSFYEATLVAALTFRADEMNNCFATAADTDSHESCITHERDHSRAHAKEKWGGKWYIPPGEPVNDLRAINLDNDKPNLNKHMVWNSPCSVPQYLRDRVTRIDNFSTALLDSIRTAEPLLAEADFVRIQTRYLQYAEPYFTKVAAQFRECK